MAGGTKDILSGLLSKNGVNSTEELLNKVCTRPGNIMNFCRCEELKLIAKLLEIEQEDNLFVRHVTEYCLVSMQLCDSNMEELRLTGVPRTIPGKRQMSPFAKMDLQEEMDDTRMRSNEPHDVPVEQIAMNKVDDYMSVFPIDPLEVTYIESGKTKKPSEDSIVLDVMDTVAGLLKNPPEYLGGIRNYTGGGTYEGTANEHSKNPGLPFTADELKEVRTRLLELIKEDEKRIMKEEE